MDERAAPAAQEEAAVHPTDAVAKAAPQAPAEGADPGEPTRVYGPTRSAVIAAVLVALTASVVLEFVIITTFVGKRVWTDPRFVREPLFTAPFALWVLLLAACLVGAIAVITSWLRVGGDALTMNRVFRRATVLPWEKVSAVLAIRDITRSAGKEGEVAPVDGLGPYEGLYLLDADGRSLMGLSGRLFGGGAQHTVLDAARDRGIQVEEVERMTPRDVRRRVHRGLSFADLHPGLMALAVLLFYVAHYVLTVLMWGL